MIIPPGPLKVMVATKPVDFRKGAVSLAALVEHEPGRQPIDERVQFARPLRHLELRLDYVRPQILTDRVAG